MTTSNIILKGFPLNADNPFLFFLIAALIIYAIVRNGVSNDDIKEFCKKKGWKVISKSTHISLGRGLSFGNNHHETPSYYDIKYFDRQDRLHNAVLKVEYREITLVEDKIIEVSELEPILEIKVADVGYTQIKYKVSEGELIIEQQYHNPNLGEKAFLNNKTAPNGRYKIGRFHTVEIYNGIIINADAK